MEVAPLFSRSSSGTCRTTGSALLVLRVRPVRRYHPRCRKTTSSALAAACRPPLAFRVLNRRHRMSAADSPPQIKTWSLLTIGQPEDTDT